MFSSSYDVVVINFKMKHESNLTYDFFSENRNRVSDWSKV